MARLTIGEAIRLVVVGARMEQEGLGVIGLGLRDHAPPPEAPTADMGPQAAIIEILRRDPSRVGPAVTILSQLRDALEDMEPEPLDQDALDTWTS